MIDENLLEILVCPETRLPLTVANRPVLDRLNQAIGAGQIENRGGRPVTKPLRGALIREDNRLVYPVIDGIPMLLSDEAILLDQLEGP